MHPDDARRARFDALARELLEPLRRYLARRTDPATADDALADALLVCWRRLDDVPAGEGALPWAYAVARGCLANAERSARRQRRVAGRVAAIDPPPLTTPGPDRLGGADAEPELHAALAALPAADAEVLRLWAWEQLEPAAIAEVLQLRPGAARSRLHRARRRLAAELGGRAGERAGEGAGDASGRAGHEGAGGSTG